MVGGGLASERWSPDRGKPETRGHGPDDAPVSKRAPAMSTREPRVMRGRVHTATPSEKVPPSAITQWRTCHKPRLPLSAHGRGLCASDVACGSTVQGATVTSRRWPRGTPPDSWTGVPKPLRGHRPPSDARVTPLRRRVGRRARPARRATRCRARGPDAITPLEKVPQAPTPGALPTSGLVRVSGRGLRCLSP